MIWILIIFSGLVRLISLNQSLWLDEAISANIASRYDFWNIINTFSVYDFHPPFYYFFLNFWEKLFGNSVISLRLPSVIFSLVSIYFVYLIGKEIKSKNIGLIAATILAVNPLFLYYSQEMRMYSMSSMFLMIALFNFVKVIRAKKVRTKNLVGLNIASFLCFTSFYGSIFFLAAMALYLLFKRKIKLFFVSNIGTVLAIAALSPLLWVQYNHSKTMLTQVVNWNLVLGKANLKNLLLIPLKFSIGRISFEPKIIYYLVGGLWSLVVFVMALKGMFKKKFLGFLMIMPIILGLVFSVFSPLLNYFRFLYLVPILALLLAFSISKNWQQLILIIVFSVFSLTYLLNQNFHREDWKSLSAKLENTQPLYVIESMADPIRYYRPDVIVKDLKSRIPTEDTLVVAPYGEAIHGLNHQQNLSQQGYQLVSTENFREMVLEKWKKVK